MSDPDHLFVCCVRVADLPVSGVVGSTRDVCATCRSDVWISPATRRVKEERDGTTICIVCAEARVEREMPEIPEIQIDPRQKLEIAEAMHRKIHKIFTKEAD